MVFMEMIYPQIHERVIRLTIENICCATIAFNENDEQHLMDFHRVAAGAAQLTHTMCCQELCCERIACAVPACTLAATAPLRVLRSAAARPRSRPHGKSAAVRRNGRGGELEWFDEITMDRQSGSAGR